MELRWARRGFPENKKENRGSPALCVSGNFQGKQRVFGAPFWKLAEPWPRHLDTKPRHRLDTSTTHANSTNSTPLDTPRHPSTPSRLKPCSSVSRCQTRHLDTPRHPSTPLDTPRHPSTPLDTARHRSTPLMILTQQRRRPIGVTELEIRVAAAIKLGWQYFHP